VSNCQKLTVRTVSHTHTTDDITDFVSGVSAIVAEELSGFASAETDPIFTTWANTYSANHNATYNAYSSNSGYYLTIQNGDIRYVNLSGDTMLGGLSAPSLSTGTLYVGASTINFLNDNNIVIENLQSADVTRFKSDYNTVNSLSSNWNATYNHVNTNSANNLVISNTVQNYSALWILSGSEPITESDPIFTTWANTYSANHNLAYTNLISNSAAYLSSPDMTLLNSASSNWSEAYNTVNSNSSVTWNYQGTDIKDISGNWQSSYTNLLSNSASYLATSTPSGNSTEIQYRLNSTEFGGIRGSSVGTTLGTGAGCITLSSGPVSAYSPVITLHQEWNNASVAFDAIKVNVVATATTNFGNPPRFFGGYSSNTYMGGAVLWFGQYVNVCNHVLFTGGGAGYQARIGHDNNGLVLLASDTYIMGLQANAVKISSNVDLGWTGHTASYSIVPMETSFKRISACDIMLQAGATSATRLRVANTYTSTTNYESAILDWKTTANTFRFGTSFGSAGGLARPMELITGGVTQMAITTAGDIGIGTTTPNTKLTVVGVISATGGNSTQWNDTHNTVYSSSASWAILPPTVEEVWIGAGAMLSPTLSGAQSVTVPITGGGYDIYSDCFNFDAGSLEYTQFNISLPNNCNKQSIKAKFSWSTVSTTGGVVWGIQCRSLNDTNAVDGAWGTAQEVTDSTSGDTYFQLSSASSYVVPSGSTSDDGIILFRVYRNPGAGGDTVAADASLLGVKLQYLLTNPLSSAW